MGEIDNGGREGRWLVEKPINGAMFSKQGGELSGCDAQKLEPC